MHRLTVTVARAGGVPLRIHLSWFLLLGWIGWVAAGLPRTAAFKLAVLTLLLVGSVLLHELAHAFAGHVLGLQPEAVTLYPFGGLATFGRLPAGELRTALVFLAGPAANVAVGIVFSLAGGHSSDLGLTAPPPDAPLLVWLAWSNLSLGLLNLIPILPLDGGQVVRTVLAHRVGELRAGRILGVFGQVAGVVVLVWGFAGRPWLVLAGLVVVAGATAELQRIHPLLLAQGQRVRDVMRTTIATVDAGVPLSTLREMSRGAPEMDFVLVEAGRPVGYLPAARLWRAARGQGEEPARALADPLGPPFDPEMSLAEAAGTMEHHHADAFPVVDGSGRLAGVLLRAGARRSLALLTAFSRRSGGGRPGEDAG